jgi:hypothetical protein
MVAKTFEAWKRIISLAKRSANVAQKKSSAPA